MSPLTSLLFVFCFAQSLNLNNTIIHFSISHLGVLEVNGTLDQVEGNAEKIAVDRWHIRGRVSAQNIRTGNASRDKTIQTEQYLNVEKYPYIPFEATLFLDDNNEPHLHVALNLRGIDLNLDFELEVSEGTIVSRPLVISREKIGLDFGGMNALIGDEIEIVIHSVLNHKSIFKRLK